MSSQQDEPSVHDQVEQLKAGPLGGLVDDLEAGGGEIRLRTIRCTCPPSDPCSFCECGDKAISRDAPSVRISVGGQVIKEIP